MSKRPSKREIAAMGYTLADEIETRALAFQRAGMGRDAAIAKVIEEMAK